MSIVKNTIPNIPRQKAPAIIHTPEYFCAASRLPTLTLNYNIPPPKKQSYF